MRPLLAVLRYPLTGDSWVARIAIGGLLVAVSALVVPGILVAGYVIAVMRRTMVRHPEPPPWNRVSRLLVDGALTWVIAICYLLLPAIVGGATVGMAVLAILTGGESGAVLGVTGLVFGGGVTVLLGIGFSYLGVVGVLNFARVGTVGAAFDPRIVTAVATHRSYAVPFVVSVGVFIVIAIVGSIPVVGWLLAPFLSFYGIVVTAHLVADGFTAAIEQRPIAPTEIESVPVDEDATRRRRNRRRQ